MAREVTPALDCVQLQLFMETFRSRALIRRNNEAPTRWHRAINERISGTRLPDTAERAAFGARPRDCLCRSHSELMRISVSWIAVNCHQKNPSLRSLHGLPLGAAGAKGAATFMLLGLSDVFVEQVMDAHQAPVLPARIRF